MTDSRRASSSLNVPLPSSSAEPLIAASGLRISWATEAASPPSAASRSLRRTCWASSWSLVRSWKLTTCPMRSLCSSTNGDELSPTRTGPRSVCTTSSCRSSPSPTSMPAKTSPAGFPTCSSSSPRMSRAVGLKYAMRPSRSTVTRPEVERLHDVLVEGAQLADLGDRCAELRVEVRRQHRHAHQARHRPGHDRPEVPRRQRRVVRNGRDHDRAELQRAHDQVDGDAGHRCGPGVPWPAHRGRARGRRSDTA